MKLKTLFIALAAVSTSAMADAYNESFYAGIGTGANISHTKPFSKYNNLSKTLKKKTFNNTPLARVFVGKSFGDVRAEVEYMHVFKASIKVKDDEAITGKANLTQDVAFVNAYYDFPTNEIFVPYVGAGVGVSKLKGSTSHYENNKIAETEKGKSKNQFAYNVGAGVKINASESVYLDFGYRFMDLGKVKFSQATDEKKTSVKSSAVLVSVGFKF